MGEKGSGGARPGAGRPRKSREAGMLTGSRRVRARAAATSAAPRAETVSIPEPPGSLTLDELAEWQDLAPQAARAGTLTEGTALALRDLCQLRVLKDRLLRRLRDDGEVAPGPGGQGVPHPLITRIVTLSQRIEAGMQRFCLAPMAKAIEPPAPAASADPFAEFEAPVSASPEGERIN